MQASHRTNRPQVQIARTRSALAADSLLGLRIGTPAHRAAQAFARFAARFSSLVSHAFKHGRASRSTPLNVFAKR